MNTAMVTFLDLKSILNTVNIQENVLNILTDKYQATIKSSDANILKSIRY